MQLRPEANRCARPDRTRIWTRAPAQFRHGHVGRERPRRTTSGPRMRYAGGVAHAPSLLRHPCWGAHRAAQGAARSHRTVGDNITGLTQFPARDGGAGDWAVARTRDKMLWVEGPTAP